PELEADHPIDLLAARAYHDHRRVTGPRGHPDAATDLGPGHVRQRPVEQHEVVLRAVTYQRQRRRPALRGDDAEALALDAEAQRVEQVAFVVDDEDRGRHCLWKISQSWSR